MRTLIPFLALLLVACSDDPTGGVDTGVPPDAAPADSRADADPDGARPDGPRADAGSADGPVVDDLSSDSKAPGDAAQTSLQVTIDTVKVWANLQPAVPPDPTRVKLELSLKNDGSAPVTGVALTDAAIVPVAPGGTAQSIQLKPSAGFTGTVPAGQTVLAKFSKVIESTRTPQPANCNDNVEVRFSVSFDSGKIGPITSAPTVFGCVY